MKARRKTHATLLIKAARDYGRALKRQHAASAALNRALSQRKGAKRLDRAHDRACDALNAAEHTVLVCAAVVGGWSHTDAEQSV